MRCAITTPLQKHRITTTLIMIGVANKDYTKRQSNLLTDKGKIMAAMHYRDNPPEHRGSNS